MLPVACGEVCYNLKISNFCGLRGEMMSEKILDRFDTPEIEHKSHEMLSEQPQSVRPGSPDAVLQIAGLFSTDEAAMREHIEAIYDKRKRQREDAERAADA